MLGLTTDVVPAVAYALLIGRLPSIEDGSPEAAERVNDVFLSVSHDSAGLPPEASSPLFLDLFKLAVALGDAEEIRSPALARRSAGRRSRAPESSEWRHPRGGSRAGCGCACRSSRRFCHRHVRNTRGHREAGSAGTDDDDRRADDHPHPDRNDHEADRAQDETPAPATPVPRHQAANRANTVPGVTTVTTAATASEAPASTVTVTTAATAGQAPASTVTVTTAAKAAKAPRPIVRVKNVVPAGCASAVAAAKSIALLAANSFGLFADYASLASDAVPAAINHDAAKMGSISTKTNSIAASLKAQAAQIARLANAVSAGLAAVNER